MKKYLWVAITSRFVSQHVVAVRTLLPSVSSASFVAVYLPPAASQAQVERSHDELESWLLHNSSDFLSVGGDWNTELLSEAGAAASGGSGTGSRAAWRMCAMHDFCMRRGLADVQERGGTRSSTRFGRRPQERNSVIDHVFHEWIRERVQSCDSPRHQN